MSDVPEAQPSAAKLLKDIIREVVAELLQKNDSNPLSIESPQPPPKKAYTIPEFAQTHSLSMSSFYKEQRAGRGPEVIFVGNKSLVTEEAAAEWRQRMAARAKTKEAKLEHARRVASASHAGKIAGQSPLHVSKRLKAKKKAKKTK
jgi:hypothetical protein